MRAAAFLAILLAAAPLAAQEQVIEENVIPEEEIIDPFLQENPINSLTLEQLANPDFVQDDIPFDELPLEQQDLLLGNQPPPGGYPPETANSGEIETQSLENAALDAGPPSDFEPQDAQMADGSAAILRGLDTLNGTVRDFTIEVGQTLEFERLHVSLFACRYPEDDIGGEAIAFLKIRDKRESNDRFSGWMLASSPALSALDHPRYDIWVLSCKTD